LRGSLLHVFLSRPSMLERDLAVGGVSVTHTSVMRQN